MDSATSPACGKPRGAGGHSKCSAQYSKQVKKTTMKLALDTIVLYVQNVDRLRKFYTDVLGLEIIEDDKAVWVLLRAGNACVGLHKIGEQYLSEISEGYKFDNNTKIVFKIEQDIYDIRQLLIDKNVLMREVKNYDNYDYLLCDGEDPEGNVFQLKQRKPVQTPFS